MEEPRVEPVAVPDRVKDNAATVATRSWLDKARTVAVHAKATAEAGTAAALTHLTAAELAYWTHLPGGLIGQLITSALTETVLVNIYKASLEESDEKRLAKEQKKSEKNKKTE